METLSCAEIPSGTELIPNGCAVRAVAFLHHYLEANPGEQGQICILALPHDEGHAIALFSKGGRVLIFDHELGEIKTTLRPESVTTASAGKCYENALFTRKQSIFRGLEDIPPQAKGTHEEFIQRALRILPSSTRPSRLTDSSLNGVVFLYDHAVWFYEPRHGTVTEPLRPGDSLATAAKRVTGKLRDKIRETVTAPPI